MNNILDKILDTKRHEVESAKLQLSLTQIERGIKDSERPRDFLGAIRKKINSGFPAVIAEIKQASPSKGLISKNFQPGVIAESYESNGAACLSVLTDSKYFKGCLDDLREAKLATRLPVLRKDFMIDRYQIAEARLAGADCILLIAAALDLHDMKDLEKLATSYGMAVLVEIHDSDELNLALELQTPLIGINNRNLQTFKTDINNTFEIISHIPEDRILVTESGIKTNSDVAKLREAGVHSFLVGEAFMTEENPGLVLSKLFGT